jgi:hypothetical protein
MKKLIFALLLIPFASKAQEVRHFCSYDAETTAKHIMKEHIKSYLHDTVALSLNYKTPKLLNPTQVEKKVLKVLKKGDPSYSSRTNSGYTFTIVVADKKDNTKILNFIKFEVDHFYQKIISIEITKE